jgi:hypothetical protein
VIADKSELAAVRLLFLGVELLKGANERFPNRSFLRFVSNADKPFPMRGKWLQRVRQIHTWLGVFFSPLLLLFIVTGWWQTFTSDEDRHKEKTTFNTVMAKFSSIHTDDYFSHAGGSHEASEYFKILVGCMAAALTLTIILGLALACQGMRKTRWMALAFILGILIPALLLYFN